MEDDDDNPPMLVAADGATDPGESSLTADIEDVKITKVPITIITGKITNIHGHVDIRLHKFLNNSTFLEMSFSIMMSRAKATILSLHESC